MKQRSAFRGLVLSSAAVAAMSAGSGGCRSVYHRAAEQLPADPNKRLAMRVQAARDAAAAGLSALEDAGQAQRVDAAAWELERAAASIGDVLVRMPDPDPAAEPLRVTLAAAAEALEVAALALGTPTDPGSRAKVERARESLGWAIADADSFLARAEPEQ